MKESEESRSDATLTSNGQEAERPRQRVSHTVSQETATLFRRLVNKLRRETDHFSSMSRTINHPAYQNIINLGSPVIPLLLAELQRRPGHWFAALQTLTQVNPVPPASAGKIEEMARAWIEWGKTQGYIDDQAATAPVPEAESKEL
jgi:hypothetical protein